MQDSIVGSKFLLASPGLRRSLFWALQLGLVSVVCWFLFRSIDVEALIRALRDIDFAFVIIAILPMTLERLLRPCRLAILLKSPRVYEIVSIQNVCQLTNLILPLRSGEMLLVIMLRGLGIAPGSRALSIVLIDRIFDVVLVLVIFVMAILMLPSLPRAIDEAALALAVVCFTLIAAILVLLSVKSKLLAWLEETLDRVFAEAGPKWSMRLATLIDGFAVVRKPSVLSLASLITIVSWGLATLGAWLVLLSMWPQAPWGAPVLAICLSVIGGTLISVPAGIGVMHASFAVAAMSFGASQELGIAYGVVGHFMMVVITTVMGLIGIPVAKRAGMSSIRNWT